jgi:hypothetical protein
MNSEKSSVISFFTQVGMFFIVYMDLKAAVLNFFSLKVSFGLNQP